MIVINGFSLLISLLQNVMFAFFFRNEFQSAFNDLSDFPKGFPTFILQNIRWLLPAMGLCILFAFISSIGLLRRKEWARKVYLFLLGFGIIYSFALAVLLIIFTRSFFSATETPSEFNLLTTFLRTFPVMFIMVIALGYSILYGWLFKNYRLQKSKRSLSTVYSI